MDFLESTNVTQLPELYIVQHPRDPRRRGPWLPLLSFSVNDYLQVSTTTDSHETAAKLAGAAVTAKMAASAQVDGRVDSFFWHQGESGESQEWRVTLKTTTQRYPDLEALLLREHTWDNPEITATPLVGGTASYFAWIDRAVASR